MDHAIISQIIRKHLRKVFVRFTNRDQRLISAAIKVLEEEFHINKKVVFMSGEERLKIVEDVLLFACGFEGISTDKAKSKGRRGQPKNARFITYYLIDKYFPQVPLYMMGSVTNRVHATVINGLMKTKSDIKTNKVFREKVNKIESEFLVMMNTHQFYKHIEKDEQKETRSERNRITRIENAPQIREPRGA